MMNLVKNVPNLERGLRLVLSAVLAIVALFGGVTPALTVLLLVVAVVMLLTGSVGWCPIYAVLGRKLKSDS
jgi:hypothetical protein